MYTRPMLCALHEWSRWYIQKHVFVAVLNCWKYIGLIQSLQIILARLNFDGVLIHYKNWHCVCSAWEQIAHEYIAASRSYLISAVHMLWKLMQASKLPLKAGSDKIKFQQMIHSLLQLLSMSFQLKESCSIWWYPAFVWIRCLELGRSQDKRLKNEARFKKSTRSEVVFARKASYRRREPSQLRSY